MAKNLKVIANLSLTVIASFFDNVEHQHKGSRCTCSIHGDLARTEEQRRSTAARGCRARCWVNTNTVTHTQTNEFAAHEQLRAAAARNRYTALGELGRMALACYLPCG